MSAADDGLARRDCPRAALGFGVASLAAVLIEFHESSETLMVSDSPKRQLLEYGVVSATSQVTEDDFSVNASESAFMLRRVSLLRRKN